MGAAPESSAAGEPSAASAASADAASSRSASTSPADGPSASAKPVRRRKRGVIPILLGLLVVCLLALSAVLAWNRWWRYDDAADFQGTWSANDTDTQVIINSEYLELSDDVVYRYTLDPMAKTISYTFGNLEGQGRYRFSLDRQQLFIVDGPDYTWFSTLAEDVPWTFAALFGQVTGSIPDAFAGQSGVTALDKVSDDNELTFEPTSEEELAAARQEDNSQREAEKAEAKAQEEAAKKAAEAKKAANSGASDAATGAEGEKAPTTGGNGSTSDSGANGGAVDPGASGDGTTYDGGYADGSYDAGTGATGADGSAYGTGGDPYAVDPYAGDPYAGGVYDDGTGTSGYVDGGYVDSGYTDGGYADGYVDPYAAGTAVYDDGTGDGSAYGAW
ncbi:hypothetical protein [Xiamenia xianingshaonis]|nr:hypothetical protein [Xiamenia xianingshaonis]QTU84304.1 hypothetical protein J7S26_08175 [Xiamenia xianingshaonis]